MRVAAIQYGNHDCSACIYDGEVQNYFLEERYSGKKHDLHHFEIYKQLLKVKKPIAVSYTHLTLPTIVCV